LTDEMDETVQIRVVGGRRDRWVGLSEERGQLLKRVGGERKKDAPLSTPLGDKSAQKTREGGARKGPDRSAVFRRGKRVKSRGVVGPHRRPRKEAF